MNEDTWHVILIRKRMQTIIQMQVGPKTVETPHSTPLYVVEIWAPTLQTEK